MIRDCWMNFLLLYFKSDIETLYCMLYLLKMQSKLKYQHAEHVSLSLLFSNEYSRNKFWFDSKRICLLQGPVQDLQITLLFNCSGHFLCVCWALWRISSASLDGKDEVSDVTKNPFSRTFDVQHMLPFLSGSNSSLKYLVCLA